MLGILLTDAPDVLGGTIIVQLYCRPGSVSVACKLSMLITAVGMGDGFICPVNAEDGCLNTFTGSGGAELTLFNVYIKVSDNIKAWPVCVGGKASFVGSNDHEPSAFLIMAFVRILAVAVTCPLLSEGVAEMLTGCVRSEHILAGFILSIGVV